MVPGLWPIPSVYESLSQIENHQRSQGDFSRHFQTRACVMKLFLTIAYHLGKELMYASVKIPLAGVTWMFHGIHLNRRLPFSVTFGEIAAHLQRASQCATVLALDLPVIFFDPSQAQVRLFNRKFIDAGPFQPKPTSFESLLNHLRTPKSALLGTALGFVVTLIALQQLGLLKSSVKITPQPPPSPDKPQTPPDLNTPYSMLVFPALAICSIAGCCGISKYRRNPQPIVPQRNDAFLDEKKQAPQNNNQASQNDGKPPRGEPSPTNDTKKYFPLLSEDPNASRDSSPESQPGSPPKNSLEKEMDGSGDSPPPIPEKIPRSQSDGNINKRTASLSKDLVNKWKPMPSTTASSSSSSTSSSVSDLS